MPHVIVKLWPGRSEDQKQQLTDLIVKALVETVGCEEKSVSVGIEEVKPENWTRDVFCPDIMAKESTLYKKPGYKPEDA